MDQVVQLDSRRSRHARHTRLRAVVVVPMCESTDGRDQRRPCRSGEQICWAVFGVGGEDSGLGKPVYEAYGSPPFASPEKELAIFLRGLDLPVALELHTARIPECRTLERLAVELGALIAKDCAGRPPNGPPDPHPLASLCTALIVAGTRPGKQLGVAVAIAGDMQERGCDRTRPRTSFREPFR